MKHSYKFLCLSIAALGLTACETGLGNFDSAPPYEMDRTATHTKQAKAEPAPIPAPEAPVHTCDFSAWEKRALQAESDLAMCQEASSRVRDAFRDELKK